MIAPLQIEKMLHRRVDVFHRPVVDHDTLCDTATVVWLTARLLRRYAQEHAGSITPDHAARLTHGLQTVEHEMHWILLNGETAEADDLVQAVSTAIIHTRDAATLLHLAARRRDDNVPAP